MIKIKIKVKIINKNENVNDDLSSIDTEGIRTVFLLLLLFFFMKDILNIKKHKQKHLSNI